MTVRSESAVVLPRLAVFKAADTRRIRKAAAFGAFMALLAMLWEAIPLLASLLAGLPLRLPLLTATAQAWRDHRMLPRALLLVLVFGIAGFVFSYRASAPNGRRASVDDGAC
jgi:type II secretory pathway component PulF